MSDMITLTHKKHVTENSNSAANMHTERAGVTWVNSTVQNSLQMIQSASAHPDQSPAFIKEMKDNLQDASHLGYKTMKDENQSGILLGSKAPEFKQMHNTHGARA